MKKNLFVIGLMLMCVCAFALPRLLSQEPVGFKELKEASAQAPGLENAKLHQLSDVKIAGLRSDKVAKDPTYSIPFPESYNIYVHSLLGWDEYALYAWGDKEMFGNWPGMACDHTQTIDGVEYLVFPCEGLGEILHLIINNNGGGSQVDGIEITANKDYYLQVNADGWIDLSNQVVSTEYQEWSEITYVDYFKDIEDYDIKHLRGLTVKYIEDSVGNTHASIFGDDDLAPVVAFDEDGTAIIELGQVLYETNTRKYILAIWDQDIVESGYVNLIDFHEYIGVYVREKESGEGLGWYDLFYYVNFFKPNVEISYSRNGVAMSMKAYAWQTESELWFSHFAPGMRNGYRIKFDIDGDKLCASNQMDYPSFNVTDNETGESVPTGDFYLVGWDDDYYYTNLYASISDDRHSFTFDTDWTHYTENYYWNGRLTPATVNLQFAINNYDSGGSDNPGPGGTGLRPIYERPEVVNNLLVNGEFEDPGYVQSNENEYNWITDFNSINADLIPGWKRVGNIWNGCVSVNEWEEYMYDEDFGFGYNGNNHYVHYQFCTVNGWTGFGLEQYVEGLTPGKEYTLDMFVGHYFPNKDANITFGIEIYDKPYAEGDEHGPNILIIKDRDNRIDLGYGDLDYYVVKFTAPSDGVIIRLMGYNYGGQDNSNGNAWVEWDEVRLYDADALIDYYLIGEKTDWEAKDEYHFTLSEGSNHIYALDSVTLAPEDTYYIANADKTIVYYLAGDEAVAPHTLYSLKKGNGWHINAADSIKNATLLADFKNLDFMVRTDGKHTIDKPYTVMYDNSLSNWENVYAYWWNGQTGQECCGFPGQQMTLQGDTIYVIDFEQDWVPTGILFSDGIGNQTADFNFVNGQTYDFNGKRVEWTVVNVPAPGEFWTTLENMTGGYYGDISLLKIVGELNDMDMANLLRMMPNLEILDLGEAVTEYIPSNWSESSSYSLKKIILPPSVTLIGSYAFSNCNNLEEVAFRGKNSVNVIQDNAFNGCGALSAFDISNVEQIGSYVFYNCRSFKNFMVSSAEQIGTYSFSGTGIEEIPKGFFIKDVTNINSGMFSDCFNLRKIDLPYTICNLNSRVFYNCPLDTVICRAIIPPSVSAIRDWTFSTYNTLLVPVPSINAYQSEYPWSNFSDIQPLLDEPIEYMAVGELLELYADADLQTVLEGCDVNLTPYMYSDKVGQLSINGDALLHLGDFIYRGYNNNRRKYYGCIMTSMIVGEECNVDAESVSVNLNLEKSGSYDVVWHFISLPFDVNYDDITASEGTVWVIRKYDTEARAAGNMNATWVNLESGDVLKAGKGYIVSAYNGEKDEYNNSLNAVMTFPAASQGNAIFKASHAPIALDEIASDMPQNRSWNFVGNPYPAYFNLHDMLNQNGEPFETPISLWRGSSYEAYCALDDDLYLRPFEAFFLQRPLDYSELIFANYGRMHYGQAINGGNPGIFMPERLTERGEREVFTFTAGIDSLTNRARIVINEKAEMGYEVGRDAMKIFETSDGCPLLYVSSDASYAICERPLAEGTAVLGFTAAKDGTYTLSLSGKHAQGWKVEVTDKLAGVTTDLAEADYEFYAEAGTNGDRFMVKFTEPALTGIDAISTGIDNNAAATVTNLAGITVYSGAYGNMPELPAGVYVITIDGTPYKVSVK